MSTNLLVRDMDLDVPVNDGCRLGSWWMDFLLTLGLNWRWMQHSSPHCIAMGRSDEEQHPCHRARLVVVVAGEVARCSEEAASFIRQLVNDE